jgi:hypothetical protein
MRREWPITSLMVDICSNWLRGCGPVRTHSAPACPSSHKARTATAAISRSWIGAYARTSPPVNVVTGADPFPATVGIGPFSAQRPNLVPGVPLRISDRNVAGGSKINSAAFSVPKRAVQGDLGRNVLSGFDTAQVDLTLRKQFKLRERLSLQARADFFNIFNHPNFASPINYLSSPQFGQATQMLA